jgi:hypothetical protein
MGKKQIIKYFQILAKSCRSKHRKLTRTRKAKYVRRHVEALSCNRSYSGKAITIKQSECVSVALEIQYVMRMRHNVTYGLPRCQILFPYYRKNSTIFGKKVTDYKNMF